MSWSETFRLACVVAFVSFTVSETKVARPIREKIGGPLKCGYCLGFWISLSLMAALVRTGSLVSFSLDVARIAWLSGMMFFVTCAFVKWAGK